MKKIPGYKSLFEVRITGKKSIGNFRMDVFLYDGIYYVAEYTYHAIEQRSIFLQRLRRALLQATERRDPVYAL